MNIKLENINFYTPIIFISLFYLILICDQHIDIYVRCCVRQGLIFVYTMTANQYKRFTVQKRKSTKLYIYIILQNPPNVNI